MHPRSNFTVALCLTLLFTIGSAQAAATDRPNILWLITEDMGPELACYGTPEVSTPVLDQLAADGVRFTRAYSTAPVCSASRSAFMTGMYQTRIGAHNHRSHRDDGFTLPPGVELLTHRLQRAGYYTANVKHLPTSLGFSGTAKTDWNFHVEGRPFDSDSWEDLASHQPFYAQVNFQESHRPFRAPRRADPNKVVIPPYYPDHEVTRTDWAAYLDAVSEADRKIGLVLHQLERDGLADNTIVIVMGDHGHCHVRGKQFCYEEGLHVPLLMRWPREFPAPAGAAPGTIDQRLVASIDVTATTLALAGIVRPEKMDGQVLFGPQRATDRQYMFGARDRCDETVFRLRTVRDNRFRYIHNFTPDRPLLAPNRYKERSYPVWKLIKELAAQGELNPPQAVLARSEMPAEELYDLEKDPHEVNNLAASPPHAAKLSELRQALDAWIEETADQGRQQEPPEVAEILSRDGRRTPAK